MESLCGWWYLNCNAMPYLQHNMLDSVDTLPLATFDALHELQHQSNMVVLTSLNSMELTIASTIILLKRCST